MTMDRWIVATMATVALASAAHAMKPGDTFEVEIPGLTTLKNTVVAAKQ